MNNSKLIAINTLLNTAFKARLLLFILVIVLVLLLILSMTVGFANITVKQMMCLLAYQLGISSSAPVNESYYAIIYYIRLPRSLLAILVGAGLAVSGVALQTLLRNPLAEPGLIGVSSGAALATVIFMFFTVSVLNQYIAYSIYILPIVAFIGSLGVVIVVLCLAKSAYGTSVSAILLVGIAINSIIGGVIGLLSYMSNDLTLRLIIFWLFGSVAQATWLQVGILFVIVGTTITLLCYYAQRMNVLLLGDAEAWHLGIDVEKIKRRIIILVAITVGAAVAFVGIIGFVGLVIPHMVRLLIGANHHYLLPVAALSGGILLLVADMIARSVMPGIEMPIGVVTALLGGLFFLYLIKGRSAEL